jgi:uncharacterized protein (TIGR03083 family)
MTEAVGERFPTGGRPDGCDAPFVEPGAAVPGTIGALLAEVCDALDADLETLDPSYWSAPVVSGMDVQGVMAHLAAEHRVATDALGGRLADVTLVDLDEATERAVGRAGSESLADTRAWWRDAVHQLHRAVSAPGALTSIRWLGRDVTALHVALDRAFSTWLHANDIRRASNRASLDPSGEHLKLLCDYVIESLPHALQLAGRRHDAVVTVQLNGPGGGTWSVPLGSGCASGETGTLQASARELCLLLGDRIDPLDFACTTRGSEAGVAAARDLIACAPGFSRR